MGDRQQRLLWLDIPHGIEHRFDPATGSDDVFGVGKPVGAVGLHSVALAATRMTGLHPVVDDKQLAVLRILADRRRSLAARTTPG